MPDFPFVYGPGGAQPVAPGGTRVRFFRRRRQGEGEESAEREGETLDDRGEAQWRSLLEEAVEELNAAFRDAGVPMTCALEDDAQGLYLHIRRQDAAGVSEELEEEFLDPADLPKWLARIRTRLGLLVDERA